MEKIPWHVKLKPEVAEHLETIQKQHGFESREQLVSFLLTGQKIVVGIPDNCNSCPCYGGFDPKTGKVICVVKHENKLSQIKHRLLVEAEACSKVGTLISLPRKEEFENEIHNLNNQVKYWKTKGDEAREDRDSQIEKLKKPQQELLTQNAQLNSRLSNMENTLLQKDSKIASLETDNQHLRNEVERLQESRLLTENDSLRQRLGEMQLSLNQYAKEIEKLEALNDKTDTRLKDVISQMEKRLRHFKENLPIDPNQNEMNLYILTLKKAIDESQGYLTTMSI